MRIHMSVIAAAFLCLSVPVGAQTAFTWVGGSGSWTTASNWSPAGVPGAAAGDSATVNTAVAVTLNAAPGNPLSTLAISGGGTLELSGNAAWTLSVTSGAGAVSVGGASAGTIVFNDDDSAGGSIVLSCASLILSSNGLLQASGCGGSGGSASGGNGVGAGGGVGTTDSASGASGGGHGGRGGIGDGSIPGGSAYGVIDTPSAVGSGGGGQGFDSGAGGAGGGRIRLVVTGALSVDGSILANGTNGGTGSGGGSGGSIWISAGGVTGGGAIQANGGAGGAGGAAARDGGGGSGGRIVIDGFSGSVSPSLQAVGGAGGGGAQGGAAGTLYLRPLGATGADLRVVGNGTPGAQTDFLDGTHVFTTMRVDGGAIIRQTTGDSFSIGALTINNGSWTHPGGSSSGVRITAESIDVTASGSIDCNGRGDAGGTTGLNGEGLGGGLTGEIAGCGSGVGGSGAGYGGAGGNGQNNAGGGATYGSTIAPSEIGSGGGGNGCFGNKGGRGGGRIRLTVQGTLTVNGSVRADGLAGGSNSGGGSGGAIYITAGNITGAGAIQANGGAGGPGGGARDGGGGGGGRITLFTDTGVSGVSISVAGGGAGGAGAAAGGAGTLINPPPDSRFLRQSPDSGASLLPDGVILAWSNFTLPAGGSFVVEIDDDRFFTEASETGAPVLVAGGITTPSYAAPALSARTNYFWHVYAVDSGGAVIGGSSIFTFSTDMFAQTVNPPPGTTVAAFRMIGFPVTPANPDPAVNIADDLGPYFSENWRLFVYDNPARSYVELPYFSGIQIRPGQGFWLIRRSSIPVVVVGQLATTAGDFTVTLGPEWNLVGHPFDFPVNFSATKADGIPIGDAGDNGRIQETLFSWTGTEYESVTQWTSGQAFWVRNITAGPVTLTIPATAVAKASVPSDPGSSAARTFKPEDLPPPPPQAMSSGGLSGGTGGGGGGGCFLGGSGTGLTPWVFGALSGLILVRIRGRRKA